MILGEDSAGAIVIFPAVVLDSSGEITYPRLGVDPVDEGLLQIV